MYMSQPSQFILLKQFFELLILFTEQQFIRLFPLKLHEQFHAQLHHQQ